MKPLGRDLDIVTIGDAMVALVAEGAPLVEATRFARRQRGDALLAAVQAARLDRAVALVTRVGDDLFGDWLIESWEAEGLHLDFAPRHHGRNSLLLMSTEDGPRRAISYRQGGASAALDVADLASVPWRHARVAFASAETQCISASAHAAVIGAFTAAREAGVTVVYDATPLGSPAETPAVDVARAFDEASALADVVILGGAIAAGKLLGKGPPDEAAREALSRGIRQIIIRDRTGGAFVADPRGAKRIVQPEPVRLGADPHVATGAFNGALIAGLSRGATLTAAAADGVCALRLAARSGAEGVFERLPTRLALTRASS